MSDVLSRGTIELVVDARRVRAGIEEAKRSIRTLGEGQRDISAAASRSIDTYITKLQTQNEVFGKSAREAALYRLALKGASDQQIAAANSALLVAESHDKMIANAAKARVAVAAIATAAVAAGAAVAVMAKEQIEVLDKLANVSRVTGIAAEDLAGLSLAAKQSGTDFDSVAKAVARMTVELGKEPEFFRAIGITAKEPIEALKQFADIFAALPDVQQRNALAQRVFSKSWQELAPLLSEGGQAIGEAVEKGKKLSGVTNELAERAKLYNDRLAELETKSVALARSVLPSLTKIVSAAADERLKTGSIFSAIAEAARVAGEQVLPKYAAQLEGAREQLAHFQEQARADPGNAAINARIEATKREIEALEEKRKKLDQIEQQQQQSAGGRPSQRADIARELDSIAADQAAKAQRAAALLNADAQIALIRQIAQEREKALDNQIAAELQAARLRVAADRESIASQADLERIELDSIGRRVQAAQQAFALEKALITSRGTEGAKVNEELRVNTGKLYDYLIARNNDYLSIYLKNQSRIATVEKEADDRRKAAAAFIADIQNTQLSPQDRATKAFQDSVRVEGELLSAVLSGNIEKQKQLRQEAERTREALRETGQDVPAIRHVERVEELFSLADSQQITKAQQAANEAKSKFEDMGTAIGTARTQLKDLQDQAAKPIAVGIVASLDAIREAATTIREQLAKETFEIKVKPVVIREGTSFSDVGGFTVERASGGMISGPGGPTGDKIPAMLSDGEFVIRSAAVRNYGADFFRALNAMHFAQGGPVGSAPAGAAAAAPEALHPVTIVLGNRSARGHFSREDARALMNLLNVDASAIA